MIYDFRAILKQKICAVKIEFNKKGGSAIKKIKIR